MIHFKSRFSKKNSQLSKHPLATLISVGTAIANFTSVISNRASLILSSLTRAGLLSSSVTRASLISSSVTRASLLSSSVTRASLLSSSVTRASLLSSSNTWTTLFPFNVPRATLYLCSTLVFVSTAGAEIKSEIPPQLPPQYNCQASREFITALNYLRDKKEIGISEKQARKMADQISRGCTGSAQRFIRAFEVLNRAEIGANTAREVALVLTQTTDDIAENFVHIFTTSFVKNELDLSSQKSVELAKKLSYDFKGNFDAAKRDFDKLISFCKREDLALPLSQCGEFMVGVILSGAPLGVSVSDQFVAAFEYMRNEQMLKSSVTESMSVAKTIAVKGPRALENFTKAFEFAIDEKGLGYNAQQSLSHALRMVENTLDPRLRPKN